MVCSLLPALSFIWALLASSLSDKWLTLAAAVILQSGLRSWLGRVAADGFADWRFAMEMSYGPIIAGSIGIMAGAGLTWLVARARFQQALVTQAADQKSEIATLKERLNAATSRVPELEEQLRQRDVRIAQAVTESTDLRIMLAEARQTIDNERKSVDENRKLLADAKDVFADTFKALSSEALRNNNQQFVELANASMEKYQIQAAASLDARTKNIDDLVKPLKEALTTVDSRIQDIEKSRIDAYSGLREQIKSLSAGQTSLQQETQNLVKALRTPNARGRWGEIQLKRVVEMAGMLEHCDFFQQQSADTEDGKLRPDLLVKLPAGRNIIVDSKVPLQAYLEALETTDDDARRRCMQDHARQVRAHVQKLSAKNYWEQFQPAPEFVVLFLPADPFIAAALEQDPGLIEVGVEQKVLLATPTTLIALLRAVAYGWKQEKLAENAQAICATGKILYERICTMTSHFAEIRAGLGRTVDAYNKTVGSLESRVLPSARKFKELGSGTKDDVEVLESYDQPLRVLRLPHHQTVHLPELEAENA